MTPMDDPKATADDRQPTAGEPGAADGRRTVDAEPGSDDTRGSIAIGPDLESSAETAAASGEEEEPSAYSVELPTFHGPLDLLLHLIKKHEVDIYDIPITLITEQYTSYLEAMEELDLDIAADYIYMAALLIHIKSLMLLPHDEDDQDIEDPRRLLVERLLEYQRFKAVAESFAELDVVRMGMWSRPPVPIPGHDASEIDMSEVGLFDLIDAFRSALRRYKDAHPQSLELQRTVHKVSAKMSELYEKLKEKSPIRLQWFLEGRGRDELIAIFLGMLELVRMGGVSLQQSGTFGEILISKIETEIDQAQFAMFDRT
jgi:segregation and condensation protein A